MKITLPLSFLLCLPAMAMADESSSNAKLRQALQDRVVDAKKASGKSRSLATAPEPEEDDEKLIKSDRRLGKTIKTTGGATRRSRGRIRRI
eukprot:scaffold41524_cov150-Skeletonema_dohrnii-CCMP3373.AAC.1